MGKKIALLIGLLFIPAMVYGADNTAASFTRTNLDARISGMGGTSTTLANYGSAVEWNPALLAEKSHTDIDLMSTTLFETTYLSAFFATKNWGIGYTNASLSGIPESIVNPNGRSQATGTSYSFSGHVVYLSGGVSLLHNFGVGVSAKYIQQSISTTNTSGVGLDLGVSYKPFSWFQTALVAENILPPTLTWNTVDKTKETLPVIIKTGVRADLIPTTLVVATDVIMEQDRSAVMNVGIEYTPISLISFRAGIHQSRLTLGTGLNIEGFRADASWEAPAQINLDDMYRFSLGLSF